MGGLLCNQWIENHIDDGLMLHLWFGHSEICHGVGLWVDNSKSKPPVDLWWFQSYHVVGSWPIYQVAANSNLMTEKYCLARCSVRRAFFFVSVIGRKDTFFFSFFFSLSNPKIYYICLVGEWGQSGEETPPQHAICNISRRVITMQIVVGESIKKSYIGLDWINENK